MNARAVKVMASAAIAAALSLCATAGFGASIEKRAPAHPRGEVEIVNVAGSVRVMGWNRDEVEVRGELGNDDDQLELTTAGTRTTIRVVLPRKRSRAGGADLIVRIPAMSSLDVNTVSADQVIDGVRGAQRLQAVSGEIHTEASGEDFHAKTISGDILLTVPANAKAASYRVETVSGDITLAKIAGELDVETVSGDMNVEANELTRLRLRTTNGDMRITTRLPDSARFDVETINGDVDLRLVGTVDAEFDIHTFNGDIESCYGDEQVRSRERGPGHDLAFTRGAGSARVRVKTLNGSVDLCGR